MQVSLGDVIGDLPPIDNFTFAEGQHYGKMDSPHQVPPRSPSDCLPRMLRVHRSRCPLRPLSRAARRPTLAIFSIYVRSSWPA